MSSDSVEDRRFPAFAMDNILRRIFLPPKKLVSKYVTPGMVVADLGSAAGYFTIPMAKIVGSSGKVYAVDFDPRMVERLKGKIEDAHDKDLERIIEAHESSAAEVDFISSGSVDFVFAHGLLCCMKDHAGAIHEMRRILKKDGGRAYLSVTKFGRRSDPRSVPSEEWKRILEESFETIQSGSGFFSRWALVRSGAKEINSYLKKIDLDDRSERRASCCCA
jgi:ubiquinone/menaquinone biosynthesis C-methylase UbiE